MEAPNDIITMVHYYFKESDCREAEEYIRDYLKPNQPILIQASRALIYLAEGDLIKLRDLGDYRIDPRDLIVMADEKAGNPKHYFSKPFDGNNY